MEKVFAQGECVCVTERDGAAQRKNDVCLWCVFVWETAKEREREVLNPEGDGARIVFAHGVYVCEWAMQLLN